MHRDTLIVMYDTIKVPLEYCQEKTPLELTGV